MTRNLAIVAVALLLPTIVVAQERTTASPAPSDSSQRSPEPSPASSDSSQRPPEPSPASSDSSQRPPEPSPASSDSSQRLPESSNDTDTSLDEYRSPVEALNERMIGTASRAVRFDWRKTKLGAAIQFSELLERNNFGSTRLGGHVRKPFGNLIGELGFNYVFVWSTPSTEKLALTPYRQSGRPHRLELDVNVLFPLAEGVATAWPGFFPATELVFSAIGGLRYSYYPGAFDGAKASQVGKSLFALQLSELELENLEKRRPGGMQIDPARYSLLVGIALDVHFQTGGYISPRAMVALPIYFFDDVARLGAWWELSIAAGWAF